MDMSDVITYPLSAAIEFCEQLDNMQDQRDLAMKVISRLELERDDALSQIAQAEKRAERFCQERDEARDALMKIEDLFIDGTDIYADREKMGMIARNALEGAK
jgi:hypothetical protein